MAEVKKQAPAPAAAKKPAAAVATKAVPAAPKPVAVKQAPAPAVAKPAAPAVAKQPVIAKPVVTTAPAAAVPVGDIRVKKSTGTKIKMNGTNATGRRKKSIARVRLIAGGTGKITINEQPLDTYFVNGFLKLIVNQPLKTANVNNFDVIVSVHGGGLTGQAGAIRHGIARALIKEDEQLKSELKKAGYLKRDPRMKERKKYGLKKARRAPQFSKR